MSMQEPNTVSGAQHPKAANALIHESSPYLLQHAYNPVAWYPWGEEAFARARREDKPVFLSIGYSTCYWCHVMEKQSFENESVARVLNAHYIAIKVDREERPDIDEQFMLVTQLMTGRGGWPNSLWLTPEGKPWMAGTYFPRPQFIDILHQLASVWDQQRDRVLEQAAQLTEAIRQSGSGDPLHAPREDRAPSREWERRAIENYRESYDPRYGGFGQAPKFPPHGALRVLNHALRTLDDQELRDIYFSTLNAMWVGGFHDHLGGGFHRYSTDARWLLPHFEKMLYDNAQLMQAFTQGYLLSGNPLYREAVVDIFNWLTREMTSPEGGFYSALDSGEVGREGEYYVWSYQEVLEVLGTEDGAWFASIYNIMPDGNFHEEATGKPSGKNIPHLVQLPADLARETGEDPREFGTRIRALSSRLLEHQRTREQPHRDDKILTSWNGLMIGALAEAGQFLNEKKYLEAAVHAAAFIVTNMKNDDDRLLRSYRAGRAHLAAYLDDMAYLADGLLALYRATGEKKWLDEAVGLAEVMLDEFQDSESGAFFFTSSKTHDRMLVRSKNSSGGGNEPDESGVAAHLLLELFVETGRVEFLNASKRTMRALSGVISQHPRALESGVYAAMVYLDHEESARVAGPVMARTKVTGEPVLPGQAFQIAVILDIEKGWHLYGENPGLDFLVPARVESEPHDGVKVKVIHATEPIQKIDPVIQKTVATYEGRVEFHFEGTVNPGACDQEIPLTFAITTQPCDATRCLPPRTDTLTVPIKIRPAD